MPLLNDNKTSEQLKLQEGWFAVRRFVKQHFEKRPDINAILFLIGMNEVAQTKEVWEKEEKQDLMHVAICSMFSLDGYYELESRDEDGWPHFKQLKELPKIELKEQDALLKAQIVKYFTVKKYI